MWDPWVPYLPPILLLSLLSGLQQVGAKCDLFFTCPEGFYCCGDRCCRERKALSSPLSVFIIFFLVSLLLLSVCGLARYFCRACKKSQEDPPLAPPTSAPPEQAWPCTLEPPPPYSEIIQMPAPVPPAEPPPPYSIQLQEAPRGLDNPTF
ncbi:transmembrane protein 92 [Tenrec ecaudatus]|uniref:transmembrane protein 92 n=1 Tax=Tenrec ecaudatus TaxID=94439 RepID=UPI003F59772A